MASNNGPAHTLSGAPRRFPCSLCTRAFRTEAGMQAHRLNSHKTTPNTNASGKTDAKSWIEIELEPSASKYRYKCPKWRFCNDIFPNFEEAYKHIQTQHPQNACGEIVSPDSPDMIKPVRVEVCGICKTVKKRKQKHVCEVSEEAHNSISTAMGCFDNAFNCLGCEQGFSTKQLFITHISQRHAHEVDSLFFPSLSEFNKWKSAMELNTRVKYSTIVQQDGKKFNRCSTLATAAQQCPSTIVTQEYSTGIQVHFYHTHKGHSCRPYTLQDKYKKNSITDYLGLALKTDKKKKLEDDLYLRFKVMMQSIIVEAKKLDIANLGLLHGMALDMTMVCNNFNYKDLVNDKLANDDSDGEENDNDDDSVDEFADSVEKEIAQPTPVKRLNSMVGKKIVSKDETKADTTPKKIVKNAPSFTSTPKIKDEDEIVKMEEVRTSKRQRFKRKFPDEETPIQKVAPSKRDKRSLTFSGQRREVTPDIDFEKITTDATIETTPKILNTFSIKDEKDGEVTPVSTPPVNGKNLLTPPTFNDSYRDFITSTLQDPMIKRPKADRDKIINKNSPAQIKTQETEVTTPVTEKYSGPSRTKPKTANTSKNKGVKKEKIRTQLGMFRPGSSPRSRAKSIDSLSPSKRDKTPSPKVKLDSIKYEVKEQENDCNILILKF
ncbi:uncharacterized protein LOC105398287 [Plutella xylostella]|uniref:uncharacterized protein LOC105398287 n=1 Tax=Plutella xylostella TaxID=51655 RepID=UPI0020322D4A|nr:uncharacterized protein LOC105398287 [Plutella xylostella]